MVLVAESEGRNSLKDVNIDMRIILKWRNIMGGRERDSSGSGQGPVAIFYEKCN